MTRIHASVWAPSVFVCHFSLLVCHTRSWLFNIAFMHCSRSLDSLTDKSTFCSQNQEIVSYFKLYKWLINAATCEVVQVSSHMFNMLTLVSIRIWRQMGKTGIEVMWDKSMNHIFVKGNNISTRTGDPGWGPGTWDLSRAATIYCMSLCHDIKQVSTWYDISQVHMYMYICINSSASA